MDFEIQGMLLVKKIRIKIRAILGPRNIIIICTSLPVSINHNFSYFNKKKMQIFTIRWLGSLQVKRKLCALSYDVNFYPFDYVPGIFDVGLARLIFQNYDLELMIFFLSEPPYNYLPPLFLSITVFHMQNVINHISSITCGLLTTNEKLHVLLYSSSLCLLLNIFSKFVPG